MKKITISILILLFAELSVWAQQNYLDQMRPEGLHITKSHGVGEVVFDLRVDSLSLSSDHLLLFTPMILSHDGSRKVDLPPIVVVGKRRNHILERPYEWKGKPQLPENVYAKLIRRNGAAQKISYKVNFPYAEWQRKSELSLQLTVIGCADCETMAGSRVLSPKIYPDKYVPNFVMPYREPEVEEVKQRQETYSAYFSYKVGRSDLLPQFGNNAEELRRVDRFVKEIQGDSDLTITDCRVSGYASPEGSMAYNEMLSRRRAEAFASYVGRKYKDIPHSVEWFGEDWKGLRKRVEKSDPALNRKEAVLAIIDSEKDVDAKDADLQALDGGITYKRLLGEFYPALRRNDFTLSFISRPFEVEEAKRVLETSPMKLSLNEMYLVAHTYPKGSPQYLKVFEVASETFPEDPLANYNVAIGEIQSGQLESALKRLLKLPKTPEVQSLLGVTYAKMGELLKAEEMFESASQSGLEAARHNAEELHRYMDDIR